MLSKYQGAVRRAAIELAKEWRMDRALRRLEAVLVAVDAENSLLISGTGDVVEPTEGVLGVGSGGQYAAAAAKAAAAQAAAAQANAQKAAAVKRQQANEAKKKVDDLAQTQEKPAEAKLAAATQAVTDAAASCRAPRPCGSFSPRFPAVT